jgi:hypothetical protein
MREYFITEQQNKWAKVTPKPTVILNEESAFMP